MRGRDAWWLLAPAPAVVDAAVRLADGGPLLHPRLAAGVAPVLLAGVALWSGRAGRGPASVRLEKELRQLVLPGLMVVALGPLLCLPSVEAVLGSSVANLGAAVLLLAAPLLVAGAFGPELEGGHWLEYLARPLSRRRLAGEKWGTAAGVLLAGVAQAQGLEVGGELGLCAALLAVGLVPPLMLRVRQASFAALVTAGLSAALMALPAGAVPLAAALALAGGLGFWLDREGLVREAPAQALLGGPGLLRGRRGPVLALLAKELQLHLGSYLVMGGMVVAWSLQRVLVPRNVELASFTALFLGLVVALWAGVAPILAEERYGTLHQDRAALPTSLVWRAKVGGSLAVALVGGALLPLALGWIAGGPGAWREAALWILAVVVVASVGLAASALLKDLGRAFLAALGATWALVALSVGSVAGWLLLSTRLSVELHRDFPEAPAEARPWLIGALLALQLVVMAALVLGVAHRTWRQGAPPRARSLVGTALGLLAVSAGSGLAQATLFLVRWQP